MEASGKNFRKRSAILTYLQHSQAHPSAETIYTDLKTQIPDLSMGTVYRNLTLFKQQGLATSVATVRGVERFDANTDPHVHFICSDCDAVIDLHQLSTPQSLRAEAENCIGCQVGSCQLSFTGLCRTCLENNRKGGESA